MPKLKDAARFTFAQHTPAPADRLAHARARKGEVKEKIINLVNVHPGSTTEELTRWGGGARNIRAGLQNGAKRGWLRKRLQDGRVRFYPGNWRFSDDPKTKVVEPEVPPCREAGPRRKAKANPAPARLGSYSHALYVGATSLQRRDKRLRRLV